MHTTHHKHLGIGACRPLCKGEAVADIVGDVLDVPLLVVVGKDDGVFTPFQFVDGFPDVGDVDRIIDIAFCFPVFFDHKCDIVG